MAAPLEPLYVEILDLASDNDGLWEFAFIGGQRHRDADDSRIERVSANPDAFRDVHQPMIEMVRAGYINLRAPSGEDLSAEEAVAVLSDASSWALDPNDAYSVVLTTRGEAARKG
jgi:hypothetical protein